MKTCRNSLSPISRLAHFAVAQTNCENAFDCEIALGGLVNTLSALGYLQCFQKG